MFSVRKKNTRKGIKVEGNRIGGRLGMGSRRRGGRKLVSRVGRNVEKLRKVSQGLENKLIDQVMLASNLPVPNG